jgi:drug/metabolite transporter (DMT)-like permease
LHEGSLVTVAPLLVSGLIWVLPLSTIGTGRRVTHRELVPAVVVTAGLAVFVQVGSPTGSGSTASRGAWLVVGAVVAVAASGLVTLARAETGPRRALYLGLATGVVYSLTAVLTKSTVDLLDGGIGNLLSHWQLYVLLAASVVGLILNQSAFQAGHVAASLPAISVTNPVLSCIFGITMFGERLDAQGPLAISVTAASMAAMALGTVALARSPLVAHEEVA